MKLSELAAPLTAPDGAESIEIKGITDDSRKVEPGFLFAAVQGTAMDGRDFIPAAKEAGAAAVLLDAGSPDHGLPQIEAADVRAALSVMAARFYAGQPETVVAVTGTNGKSSTVEFLRQIWARAGYRAAALGTLCVSGAEDIPAIAHTTPGPVDLHKALQALERAGVTHLAMEASSHGLKQRRSDGVRLAASGFSNLTQDHFDYHPTFEDYYASKRRLFDELTPKGAPCVINVDGEWGRRMAESARQAGLDVRTIGWSGEHMKIEEIAPKPDHQILSLRAGGRERLVRLNLVGEFQSLNALLAAALAVATGAELNDAIAAIETLTGVRGRLEPAGATPNGAQIFVDYAHTPDGLDKLLRALRPHTRNEIWAVFGAGGDRDPTKRDKMGAVTRRLADRRIVTDDNPRSEDAAAIRAAVLKGVGEAEALEIGDRREAIRYAVSRLQPGDALVIAGKGHETYQIYGDETREFDDVKEAQAAIEALNG